MEEIFEFLHISVCKVDKTLRGLEGSLSKQRAHFIDFETKINTFPVVRASGYASKQIVKPTECAMPDMVVARLWSDCYSEDVFHHVSRGSSL